MLTYVFPGQGSQSIGMGKDLFDEFKELTTQADEILGYSIRNLCLEDPQGNLNKTQYTQPALYIVNALSYIKRIRETDKKPDFVAGHSLGEYSALFAAGAFDFQTGLQLVKKRGELMSLAKEGEMGAVIGLTEEQVTEVLSKNNLTGIDIANYNTPHQIIIAGPREDMQKAGTIFESTQGVRLYTKLKVSGAFHSRYMNESRLEFQKFLETFHFNSLDIPVISNVYARPYKLENLKQTLAEQINNSVKWTESIRYLMGKGEMVFEEIGPGRVLTGLIQKIKKEAKPLVLEDNTGLFLTKEIGKLYVSPLSLGSSEFKEDYKLKYAYMAGGMNNGISSKEMVVTMARAGMLSFFGTTGLELSLIKEAIDYIQKELSEEQTYGFNFTHNPSNPEREERLIDLFLTHGIRNIEASSFLSITPALIRYRAKGLTRNERGEVVALNRIIAKISRPEVAEAFLSPVPDRIITKLMAENKITREEADLLKEIPIADDICVEGDSGGYTDGGVVHALMPAIIKLRDEVMSKYNYPKKIRIGAAGGIGTPEAAAAAFILGADFIVTGSINQCTVEAATSGVVKDLLQQINVQDTEYAPAGDRFELGSKVQVLKKGVFFPARANRLYDLYRQYNSIVDIDEKTKTQIQERYFKKDFEQVYKEIKSSLSIEEINRAEQNPKYKMALIFKWYFDYSNGLALKGDEKSIVDYQVYCGPALGAFNQWVKGTSLESWKNRHVDKIGLKLIIEAAELLNRRINSMIG